MIRKTIIVVLTMASFYSGLCWGMSYLPKASSLCFRCGPVEWHVQEGASFLVHRTCDHKGGGTHKRSYNLPPICIFLSMFVAYPAVACIRGPFRRWLRRNRRRCVACGAAIAGRVDTCSQCGGAVNRLVKITSSMWFALTAVQAGVMFLCAWELLFLYLGGGSSDTGQMFVSVGVVACVALTLGAPLCGFIWSIWYVRNYNRGYLAWRYCPTCRYDLTGNVSGVCPECGTEIKRP